MTEVLLAALILVAALLVIWMVYESRKKRQRHLRMKFRSEYDRELADKGARRAEHELERRERRVAGYAIHPLNPAQYERFSESWRATQNQFVDNPSAATIAADHLVTDLMTARGYPMNEFADRAADLSVDHPRVVANYRAARGIAESSTRGEATTEDLRQAFVHYRELFEELLVTANPPGTRQYPAESSARPVHH